MCVDRGDGNLHGACMLSPCSWLQMGRPKREAGLLSAARGEGRDDERRDLRRVSQLLEHLQEGEAARRKAHVVSERSETVRRRDLDEWAADHAYSMLRENRTAAGKKKFGTEL